MTDNQRLDGARWRKASRSATNGECVEIAQGASAFGVRDSKNSEGSHLVLLPATWTYFLANTKEGQR
ncbi:MAG: DUF397 domain-containing protein [Candidatus Dormibacteraceae bacterium]